MRKKKRNKKRIITAFAVSLSLAVGLPCYADTTDDEIASITIDNDNTQNELVSVEERLAALEEKKGDTESYLNELTAQLSDINAGLASLQASYDAKQQEITETQAQLDASKEKEQEQYDKMKLRIQYIYEESVNSGMLDALLSADSFTDFLNRAEEMSEITKYDREMLQDYSDTVAEIETEESRLLEEQANISDLQNQMEQQQEAVELIYEDSYRDLEATLVEIENSENAQTELADQIREQEEVLDQLMAQKYAEEEAARQAEAAAAAQAAAQAQAEAEEAAAEAAAQAAAAQQQAEAAAAAQAQAQSEAEAQAAAEAAAEAQAQAEAAAAAQAEAEAQAQAEAEAQAAAEAAAQETESQESSSDESSSSEDTSGGNMTYLGHFTLTAYCSCAKCCGKWAAYGGCTASGAHVEEGVTVAMGGVPFGTKLSINGHIYTVQDRGTPYGWVDIWFPTHEQASAFGQQYADVYQVN